MAQEMGEKDIFTGFSQKNLNFYLNELAKDIKKIMGRNADVEVILVGGGAVIAGGYDFREMTMDIDFMESYGQSIKDAVHRTGDRLGLPSSWMNSDFTKTDSYSENIRKVSRPYKTFRQVLHVRSLGDNHLVAMKLASDRLYKFDRSDIVGIVTRMDGSKEEIEKAVKQAVKDLYGDWGYLKERSQKFFEIVLENLSDEHFYEKIRDIEKKNKDILIDFEEQYPDILNNEIADNLLEPDVRTALKNIPDEKSDKGEESDLDREISAARTESERQKDGIQKKMSVEKNRLGTDIGDTF